MAAVGGIRGFGELEATIMDRLWSRGGPATVRDMLTELLTSRHLAYTTVMTVMDNLYKKGWLTREPVNRRAWRYRTVLTREQYVAQLMRQVLDDSDDRTAALIHFVDNMTADETAAIRDALSAFEGPVSEK